MSVQLVGVDTLAPEKSAYQPFAARMIAKTIAIVVGGALRIADEVAYTIREDFRHGQISRDPKDWEL